MGQNWEGGNQAVVGAGVEFRRAFNGGAEFLELDVTDNGFIFRFTNNFAGSTNNPQGFFNLGLTGLTLSDLDPTGGVPLGNLVLVSSTWSSNVFASQTLGVDSVAFDFTNRNTIIPGKGTVWEALFEFQDSSSSVPEPSTAWLGALSLSLLAAATRRRRSA